MRIVLIGINHLTIEAARQFLKRGDEVVIIDGDRQRLEDYGSDIDVAFIEGDGSRPHILRQADPRRADVLYALTGDDQDNILAALVGRSLGAPRVVPKIDDPEFRPVCLELGLTETINPDVTIARALVRATEEESATQELSGEEEEEGTRQSGGNGR